MNNGIAGLGVGILALALTLADGVLTGRFLDRVSKAEAAEPAPDAPTGTTQRDDDLQALRMAIEDLNNDLRNLSGGPITSEEQLAKVVDEHMAYRRRRESVHRFATRKQEIRLLTKDWADQQKLAFKFSDGDAEKCREIMKRVLDSWLALASTTGGEPDLESKIEAILAEADVQILALIPESERKRYRKIPRGWSSGLVGDPDFGK